MERDLYLGFVLATTVLILIPGPAVTLIIGNSLAHGSRRALITVAGTSSAIAVQLAVVAFGMASFMLVLAQWFEWLRWAGVAYLIVLGIQQWRAAAAGAGDGAAPAPSPRRLFWQGFVVNGTNPKTLFFYAAFFPQFVDPALAPAPQLALLCTTFLVIATVLDGSYAILGGRLGGLLKGRARARLRARIGGALLVGAGIGLALIRRN